MADTRCFGIDLGTTNSAIALSDMGVPGIVEVSQLVEAGVVAKRPLLPSATYLPFAGEFDHAQLTDVIAASGSETSLPQHFVGVFARNHGALSPERLVASAKSWLCQSLVERTEPILPWGASDEVPKISPVDAAASYLSHLITSTARELNVSLAEIAASPVVITVPASFDEVARNLTTRAAQRAGLSDPVLLEEPLAAFYSWLAQHSLSWREELQVGDVVLVCDVGGGTADFTLIAVTEQAGELVLERICVGEHILLGGDNMDLAIAETLRGQLEDEGKTLDNWQFRSLVHQSRVAKESLLADPSRQAITVGIASRGASLFSSAISVTIERRLVEQLLLTGFFPLVPASVEPIQRRSGLREIGLDYAADPAITKHLAVFLRKSAEVIKHEPRFASLAAEAHDFVTPTAILFNGGVFKSDLLRNVVLQQLREWAGSETIRELNDETMESYDGACALGAAYYAHLMLTDTHLKVRAGLPRSYFLGIESLGLAVPGARPRLKALCVAPRGAEEGVS